MLISVPIFLFFVFCSLKLREVLSIFGGLRWCKGPLTTAAGAVWFRQIVVDAAEFGLRCKPVNSLPLVNREVSVFDRQGENPEAGCIDLALWSFVAVHRLPASDRLLVCHKLLEEN